MAREPAKKKTPAKAAKAAAAKKPVAKATVTKAAAAKKPVAKTAAKPVPKKELNDYSGPYNPNLTFNDLSKEFILKLMQVWQYAWLHMTEAWYDAVKEKVDKETADVCETAAWCRIGERVNPRFAKVANIERSPPWSVANLGPMCSGRNRSSSGPATRRIVSGTRSRV